MSKARTWSVRLSVDDLNASFCLLETDQEVAAWVRGLMRGLNGGGCKDGASAQYVEGWEIGLPARERADEIRSGCAETGRAGGNKRVANAQANASPDASPIGQPVAQPERRTKNEEQETKERKKRFSAEAEEIYKAYPLKVAPDKAKAAIEKALKRVDFATLIDAVKAYAAARSGQDPAFTKQPQGWFNDSRWLDDRSTWAPKQSAFGRPAPKINGFTEEYHKQGMITNADGSF